MIHIPRIGDIFSCPMCGFSTLERVSIRYHNGMALDRPLEPCTELLLASKAMEDEDAEVIRRVVGTNHICRKCPCGYSWVERPATDRTAYSEPEAEDGS